MVKKKIEIESDTNKKCPLAGMLCSLFAAGLKDPEPLTSAVNGEQSITALLC